MAKEHIPVRVEPVEIERLDAIARAMAERAGVEITRSAALRAVVSAGLAAEEKRLGIAPPAQKGSKPRK